MGLNTKNYIKPLIRRKVPVHKVYPAFTVNSKPKSFNKKDPLLRLLFVGTVYERKGVEFLIKAINLIDEKKFFLDLVGSKTVAPKYVEYIESLINEFCLADKVKFHGHVINSMLCKLYSEADIFIMPSLWEGYGMAIIEAHYNKLPVIASNVGGITEIVKDGINGYLVEPRDFHMLSNRIKTLGENIELRHSMGKNGYDMIDTNYSWEVAGERFYKIINQIK